MRTSPPLSTVRSQAHAQMTFSALFHSLAEIVYSLLTVK